MDGEGFGGLFIIIIILGILYLIAYVMAIVLAAALFIGAMYGLIKTIANYVRAFKAIIGGKAHIAVAVVLPVSLVALLALAIGSVFYMYKDDVLIFNEAEDEQYAEISDMEKEPEIKGNQDLAEENQIFEQVGDSSSDSYEISAETNMVSSEYILQDSDKRYITKDELLGLTPEQCRLARNEIYARHGRMFDAADLQAYFNSCSWYQGTIPAADFKDDMYFNDFEKANRDLIVQYESEQGYR